MLAKLNRTTLCISAAATFALTGPAMGQGGYPDEPVLADYLVGVYGFRAEARGLWSPSHISTWTVEPAGDLNNDGLDDVVVSMIALENGRAAVFYGRQDGGFKDQLRLEELDGQSGFLIRQFRGLSLNGVRAAIGVGDTNSDGIDDLFVDTMKRSPGIIGYIVHGREEGFPAEIVLSELDATQAVPVRLEGDLFYALPFVDAAIAGDLNADGQDDLIFSVANVNIDGQYQGRAYVVYGQPDGLGDSIDLHELDGVNGTTLVGLPQDDRFGRTVAAAGDLNGDGIDDVVVGASGLRHRLPAEPLSPGAAYAFFGAVGGLGTSVSVAELHGTNGFAFLPGDSSDQPIAGMGNALAGLGDFNGDGIDDVAIGAPGYKRDGVFAGAVFVLHGRAGGFPVSFTPADLTIETGQTIYREPMRLAFGWSLSNAGDVNGDGAADLIIGSPRRSLAPEQAVLVFGRPDGGPLSQTGELDVSQADGTTVARLASYSAAQFGASVSGIGDLNTDGMADVAITAPQLDGSVFIHFGGGLCPVDLTADGTRDVFDFLEFFNLFDARDQRANWDGEIGFTLFDFLAYQADFDAGCP